MNEPNPLPRWSRALWTGWGVIIFTLAGLTVFTVTMWSGWHKRDRTNWVERQSVELESWTLWDSGRSDGRVQLSLAYASAGGGVRRSSCLVDRDVATGSADAPRVFEYSDGWGWSACVAEGIDAEVKRADRETLYFAIFAALFLPASIASSWRFGFREWWHLTRGPHLRTRVVQVETSSENTALGVILEADGRRGECWFEIPTKMATSSSHVLQPGDEALIASDGKSPPTLWLAAVTPTGSRPASSGVVASTTVPVRDERRSVAIAIVLVLVLAGGIGLEGFAQFQIASAPEYPAVDPSSWSATTDHGNPDDAVATTRFRDNDGAERTGYCHIPGHLLAAARSHSTLHVRKTLQEFVACPPEGFEKTRLHSWGNVAMATLLLCSALGLAAHGVRTTLQLRVMRVGREEK